MRTGALHRGTVIRGYLATTWGQAWKPLPESPPGEENTSATVPRTASARDGLVPYHLAEGSPSDSPGVKGTMSDIQGRLLWERINAMKMESKKGKRKE